MHSGWSHLEALIQLAATLEVPDSCARVHRGRDTAPKAGAGYLKTVQGWMEDAGAGRVGSVIGRYFAMDRDRRWDRVQKAYDLLVHGGARRQSIREEAARAAYERDETDEFIAPTLVGEEARIRRATPCWRSTSGPTGCGRSPGHWPTLRLTG